MQFEKEIRDNLYKSLEMMFDISTECQKIIINENPNINKTINLISFSKEFATIKLCGPRQSGHTTAIMKLICEKNLNSICYFHNYSMAKRAEERFKVICSDYKKVPYVHFDTINAHSISSDSEYPINAIFVDIASFISTKNLDRIYNTLGCHGVDFTNPYYIILIQ